jgi:hypothetical protein
MKKELNVKSAAPKARISGRKRKFFAKLFSLFLLGNLFAMHHDAAAQSPNMHNLDSYSKTHKQRSAAPNVKKDDDADDADDEDSAQAKADVTKTKDLWAAAALLARPLLFEHEDCELFQGKKKIGNFGVFWPKRIELPTDGAFRRYVNSEKQKVAYIVERLGSGPERELTLYQMAQIYSFVHNTTLASGTRALDLLKKAGMNASQAFMSQIDRVKGMKTPLPGLAQRRKDEVKLGKGELDVPISRRMPGGKPHTLASLQAHYNAFVSKLGEAPNEDALSPVRTEPQEHTSRKADEPAVDPI